MAIKVDLDRVMRGAQKIDIQVGRAARLFTCFLGPRPKAMCVIGNFDALYSGLVPVEVFHSETGPVKTA